MTITSEISGNKLKISEPFFNILKEEGFFPTRDNEGDINFKYQGGIYLILIDVTNPPYMRLCYPGFYTIEKDEETLKVLLAINIANKAVKIAKTMLFEKAVWSVIEAFVPDAAYFKTNLMPFLVGLQAAANTTLQEIAK